ncbi:MAG: hypothetical protein P1P93_10860 [Gammaproteobacteria bacterium]|nr:hypothetical protein [Gammaproteobacteria bacterium]
MAKQAEIELANTQLHDNEQQLIKVQAEFEQAEKDHQQRDDLKAELVKLNSYKDSLTNIVQFEKTAQSASANYDQANNQQTENKHTIINSRDTVLT